MLIFIICIRSFPSLEVWRRHFHTFCFSFSFFFLFLSCSHSFSGLLGCFSSFPFILTTCKFPFTGALMKTFPSFFFFCSFFSSLSFLFLFLLSSPLLSLSPPSASALALQLPFTSCFFASSSLHIHLMSESWLQLCNKRNDIRWLYRYNLWQKYQQDTVG